MAAGATLVASAADLAKPDNTSTTMSAAKNSASAGGLDAADKAYDTSIGQRLAQSGAVTSKPPQSATKKFFQSVNPFAPMKPAPTTPWISRASWNEIATTEHERSATSESTGMTNHELKIKVTVLRN